LAIKDAFVSVPLREAQACENRKIRIYRLPSSLGWRVRQRLALDWINEKKPDWVSLQFVPFTFHPKGICLQLGGLLKGIKQNARLHVMVHEPWILWSFRFSFKLRFLGVIQKLAVVGAFKMIPPDAISTSLPLYKRELRVIGKHVELLPLFGNIPRVNMEGSRDWLLNKCPAGNLGDVVIAGFFGQISQFLSLRFLSDFIDKHCANNKRVVIFHAGGLGPAGLQMWNNLTLARRDSVSFVSLGRLSELDATRYFQGLDYGLTSYSAVTWGKSGVVAAMFEHGLRVIPCGDDTIYSDKISSEGALPSPWNVDLAATTLKRLLGAG
jgi:hypothetical protein